MQECHSAISILIGGSVITTLPSFKIETNLPGASVSVLHIQLYSIKERAVTRNIHSFVLRSDNRSVTIRTGSQRSTNSVSLSNRTSATLSMTILVIIIHLNGGFWQ
ncbi:hypothetical protein CY34DRAFT_407676 [Suillus luteus UH-Slu-Lm8-n1]|uniref:Uncharacterized protein n=1 Tax=Suillus luteus UH-Slu-Lm8-n1 TaxID=930992 RepID=A0A0D0B2G6_9AGAM|nr:hypothetical protein CY34DRAFT_407676 [Suillus luteus UH-Slu-Lm8-n1]